MVFARDKALFWRDPKSNNLGLDISLLSPEDAPLPPAHNNSLCSPPKMFELILDYLLIHFYFLLLREISRFFPSA